MFKFSGKRPSNLGAKHGRLAPVVNKPNNVSSQADPSDRGHYVAPLKYSGDPAAALKKLAAIVARQPGARVIRQDADYLYAEFETKLMGFVDDVEFLAAPGALHVRSASRLGYSDMGVNRKRVEALRAAFGG